MGLAKQHDLEQRDHGYSAPSGFAVCASCLEDDALKAFISDNAVADECSFCGRTSEEAIAADTDTVLTFIASRLKTEWSDALEELYFDRESDSGFAGPTHDIGDVLEHDAPICSNDDFEAFVLDAFSETTYTPHDFLGTGEGDALSFGWDDLVDTVKHRQRFFFALGDNNHAHDGAGVPIPRGAEMLDALGRLVHEYGLVKELPAGVSLYRARQHAIRKRYTSAKDLGSPPEESASQSRMSPAGIPMLYTADDPETAVAEVVGASRSRSKGITIATFRTTEPLRIVDLSQLDQAPSIFDDRPETTRMRQELGFLHGFRRDIGGNVDHDGQEHIEYVPTQVVCEYLRHQLPLGGGTPVHGVAWESTKHPGARNVVLFFNRDQCVEERERPSYVSGPLAELVATECRRLP